MKNSKRDAVRRMQKEDALGISRRKKNYIHIDRHMYRTFKIVMAIVIPVTFFLYSPALIFAVLAYVAAVCVFNINAEAEMNDNYRADCHVKMPKYDVALAVTVLLTTLAAFIVSQCFSKNADGMLADFSGEELEDFIDKGKIPVEFSSGWFKIRQVLVNIGSLMTGERSLFSTLRIGMQPPPQGMGGGGMGMPQISITDLPLSFVFSTVFSVLNTVLIFGLSLLSLLSLRGVKKVYRLADTGGGRRARKLRFAKEEVRTVERDIQEIKKEQDILLKIFEDELLDDDCEEEGDSPVECNQASTDGGESKST